MAKVFDYKTGGVIGSPITGGGLNYIMVNVATLEDGAYYNIAKAGSQTTIFAQIFLMARGDSTATGVYIKRATYIGPNSNISLPMKRSWQEGDLRENFPSQSSINWKGVYPVATALSTTDHVNTVPQLHWPFNECFFEQTGGYSGVVNLLNPDTITVGFSTHSATVSDVFWEMNLKVWVP